MNQPTLNISWASISKIIISVIAVYVIFMIKDIIVWFIFALVIGILFNYIIDALEKKKIPRFLSASFLYLCIFVAISFFIYKTAPIMLKEFTDFAQNLPSYIQKISPIFEKFDINVLKDADSILPSLQNNLVNASTSLMGALFSIFGGATSTILVIAMAFFISVERNFFEKVLTLFTPKKHKDYLFRLWNRSKRKVSGWFITRVVGVLFIGAGSYLVLSIFNVKYALLLSIVAGLLDIVPIIGPIVAGALLGGIVALVSLTQSLFVMSAFVILQLLENNLLFPILFKKFVGISPVLVLIALAVGARLSGVAGAILAIPLAGVVFEILKDYLKKMRAEEDDDNQTGIDDNILASDELKL